MGKTYWTSNEVIEIFNVTEGFIARLEHEQIICPISHKEAEAPVFSAVDMEKLRIAKILVEEMDVNLPGVEVILQMRQNMIAMRQQFDDILEAMSGHLRETLK